MDVSTDWVNGVNLIEDGDTIWGLVMSLLPFVPGAIMGFFAVIAAAFDEDTWKGKCLTGLLGIILYVPGVIICTPLYMLFVLVSGFLKVLNPEIETLPEEDLGKKQFCGADGGDILKIPPLLRMAEVAMESYPQSTLGEFHFNPQSKETFANQYPLANVKRHCQSISTATHTRLYSADNSSV